jgi:hypothetical protein
VFQLALSAHRTWANRLIPARPDCATKPETELANAPLAALW